MDEIKERILVYVELREGKLHPASQEVLSEARRFASRSGVESAALLFSPEAEKFFPQIAQWGVKKIYFSAEAMYGQYDRAIWLNALAFILSRMHQGIFLFAASPQALELLPAAAIRLKLPIISGVTFFRSEGKGLQITSSIFMRQASSLYSWGGEKTLLLGLMPRVFEAEPISAAGNPEAVAVSIPPDVTGRREQITLLEAKPDDLQVMDLEDAEVVVSGGRGLKAKENFQLVEELARELGGVVGGSRAAVDNHWVDRSRLVGQTGKSVAAELYIACGISGATQHVMGIKGSRYVLAINTDKEAPIFKVTNLGVVGDLFAVVPEMTKCIREKKKKIQTK